MKPIELVWAGGEHSFLLRIDELRALQQKCDAGPEYILNRLHTKQWLVDDVVETIRLALMGGGMASEDCKKIIKQHIISQPLSQFVITAQLALANALYGVEDDPVGESQAGAVDSKTNPSRMENTDGQGSTPQE